MKKRGDNQWHQRMSSKASGIKKSKRERKKNNGGKSKRMGASSKEKQYWSLEGMVHHVRPDTWRTSLGARRKEKGSCPIQKSMRNLNQEAMMNEEIGSCSRENWWSNKGERTFVDSKERSHRQGRFIKIGREGERVTRVKESEGRGYLWGHWQTVARNYRIEIASREKNTKRRGKGSQALSYSKAQDRSHSRSRKDKKESLKTLTGKHHRKNKRTGGRVQGWSTRRIQNWRNGTPGGQS